MYLAGCSHLSSAPSGDTMASGLAQWARFAHIRAGLALPARCDHPARDQAPGLCPECTRKALRRLLLWGCGLAHQMLSVRCICVSGAAVHCQTGDKRRRAEIDAAPLSSHNLCHVDLSQLEPQIWPCAQFLSRHRSMLSMLEQQAIPRSSIDQPAATGLDAACPRGQVTNPQRKFGTLRPDASQARSSSSCCRASIRPEGSTSPSIYICACC